MRARCGHDQSDEKGKREGSNNQKRKTDEDTSDEQFPAHSETTGFGCLTGVKHAKDD